MAPRKIRSCGAAMGGAGGGACGPGLAWTMPPYAQANSKEMNFLFMAAGNDGEGGNILR
jgi:hypothetical protein